MTAIPATTTPELDELQRALEQAQENARKCWLYKLNGFWCNQHARVITEAHRDLAAY